MKSTMIITAGTSRELCRDARRAARRAVPPPLKIA